MTRTESCGTHGGSRRARTAGSRRCRSGTSRLVGWDQPVLILIQDRRRDLFDVVMTLLEGAFGLSFGATVMAFRDCCKDRSSSWM
jgi:hypothetical protein